MKRAAFFIIFVFCFSSIAMAATGTATPTLYQVTFNKVELHNKDTNTWVTIGEGDMSFDIASKNAGQAVGNYFSNTNLPIGTYDKVRTTIARNMQLTGTGIIGVTTYYTTANQVANFGAGTPLGKAISTSTVSGAAVEGTFQVPGDLPPSPPAGYTRVSIDDNYFVDEIASPTFVEFSVATNDSKIMTLNFDVAGKLTFDTNCPGGVNCAYCNPPVVSATIQ